VPTALDDFAGAVASRYPLMLELFDEDMEDFANPAKQYPASTRKENLDRREELIFEAFTSVRLKISRTHRPHVDIEVKKPHARLFSPGMYHKSREQLGWSRTHVNKTLWVEKE
jgi:hypothetical protein